MNIAKANTNSGENKYRADIINPDEIPGGKNPAYTVDQRVEDLLSRLSLVEKVV